ncbi:hypothetical protein BH20ACI2_BH20ACI2_29120 [soil metagenome]
MTEKREEKNAPRSAATWNKVYLLVVVTTVVVIAALWSFSRYFQ